MSGAPRHRRDGWSFHTQVLTNYAAAPAIALARVAVAIEVTSAIPLQLHPSRECIKSLLPRDARIVFRVLPPPLLLLPFPLQAPLLEQLRVLSTIRFLLAQLLVDRSFALMFRGHVGPFPLDAPLLPELVFPLLLLLELLGALLRRDVGLELALPHVGHGLLSALVAVGLADIPLELAGRVADMWCSI